MRKTFLCLILLITGALTANQGSLFRNEDSGLVVEIPNGLKRTWSVNNHEWGLELTVFQEGDEKAIILATIPKENAFVDHWLPTLEDPNALLASYREDNEEDDFSLKVEESLANEEYSAMRIHVEGDFEIANVSGDIHFFQREKYVTFIGTVLGSEEKVTGAEEFSKSVLETVRFIEE